MQFDAFISHAWEDKEDFVRELAEKLQAHRIEVWYDEFSLRVGDSLRQSIDFGLSKSRFGIVILSNNFFNKRWTNWELDGLVQRQNDANYNLIIPIWYKIDKKAILEYSPSLADKVAIRTVCGIEQVVQQIDNIINPKGSTLIIARDLLIKYGFYPPVITDDWWLDVLEYCGKEYLYHEYLSFSIPWKSYDPQDRGEYIGLHALQMLWQQKAEEQCISQLTPPNQVLEFINSQSGLKEVCAKEPLRVAFFLPQLTIRNYGGFLEPLFDSVMKRSPRYSSNHECEEEMALRHPELGNYGFANLACVYFTGAGGGIGPSTRRYDLIDCLFWLLSRKSSWLPDNIKKVLYRGMIDWSVWEWTERESSISGFKSNSNTGALLYAMIRNKKNKSIKLTQGITKDIKTRIQHAIKILNLPESADDLFEIFIKEKIIESWILKRNEIRASNSG